MARIYSDCSTCEIIIITIVTKTFSKKAVCMLAALCISVVIKIKRFLVPFFLKYTHIVWMDKPII